MLLRQLFESAPTAKTLSDFAKMAQNSSIKQIIFDGETYTRPKSESHGIHINGLKNYQQAWLSENHVVRVYLIDNVPYKIAYEKDVLTRSRALTKGDWSVKEQKPVTVVLDSNLDLKAELGIPGEMNKESIIKALLAIFKHGIHPEYEGDEYWTKRANTGVKKLIHKLKRVGYDYPEFKAFEKSISATKRLTRQTGHDLP